MHEEWNNQIFKTWYKHLQNMEHKNIIYWKQYLGLGIEFSSVKI